MRLLRAREPARLLRESSRLAGAGERPCRGCTGRREAVLARRVAVGLPEPVLRAPAGRRPVAALGHSWASVLWSAEPVLRSESVSRIEPVLRSRTWLRSVPSRRASAGVLRVTGLPEGRLLRRLAAPLVVAPGWVAGRRAEPARAVPARRNGAVRQDAGLRGGSGPRVRNAPSPRNGSGLRAVSGLRGETGRGDRVAARAGRGLCTGLTLPCEAPGRLAAVARSATRVLGHSAWIAGWRTRRPAGTVAALWGTGRPGEPAARILCASPGGPGDLVPGRRHSLVRTRLAAEPVRVGLHGALSGRTFESGGVV